MILQFSFNIMYLCFERLGFSVARTMTAWQRVLLAEDQSDITTDVSETENREHDVVHIQMSVQHIGFLFIKV